MLNLFQDNSLLIWQVLDELMLLRSNKIWCTIRSFIYKFEWLGQASTKEFQSFLPMADRLKFEIY